MTAVASPVPLQTQSRAGWNPISGGQSGLDMSSEDMSRMFMPGPRKSAQRTKSSSSLISNASNATVTASTAPVNGNTANSTEAWAARKKTSRGLWPPGKSEPVAGITTARPQSVSSASSGPTAASAISALHTPMLPSQQPVIQRDTGAPNASHLLDKPTFLYLLPMNNTFERKTISVPFYPDVLRIGRQTNAKTAPTATNGFFDSKVLSRQHAEVYAERDSRVFIRDVKSSNGTFVNGKRLSPENKESEPHEIREQDVLELGIDIVSEDQKTVVHHKVAARVEHAGMYPRAGDINFGDLDPSGANGFPQQMKRNGSAQSVQGAKANALAAAAMAARNGNEMQQQGWSQRWLQPISTEQVVKRLNRELSLARQQSQDLARTRMCIEEIYDVEKKPDEKQEAPKSTRPSPTKLKAGAQFPEPPAPPPQQPLPEKPDVARALADPIIQPLLQRADTARPTQLNMSPTRADHSQALLILTHELKMAKDHIPSLEGRVKDLEQQLHEERTARETAEQRAQQLEHVSRKDSARDAPALEGSESTPAEHTASPEELQRQMDRLNAIMDDLKQQMEEYRKRAETAETERDETRQTLAEMIEQKRRDNADGGETLMRGGHSDSPTHAAARPGTTMTYMNGHAASPKAGSTSPMQDLLEKAGVDATKPMTTQQAMNLQRLIGQEIMGGGDRPSGLLQSKQLAYLGLPPACALTTVVIGLALMHYLNGWEKIQSVLNMTIAVILRIAEPATWIVKAVFTGLQAVAVAASMAIWVPVKAALLHLAETAWRK